MVEVSVDGVTYDKDALEKLRSKGADSFLVLNGDGKAVLVFAGTRNADFSWEASDSATVRVKFANTGEQDFTFDGSQLKMESNGGYMVFEKGEPRASLPAITESSSASSASASAAASNASASAASSSASKSSAKYEATIDDITVGEDYQGKPALIVTYSWQNNSDSSKSFAAALHPRCYQNGVQLGTAIVMSGIDSEGYLADVKPGYGTQLQMAYELKDTENPVDVEVYELASYKGDPIATKTYKF